MKMMVIGSLLSSILITGQAEAVPPPAYLTPNEALSSDLSLMCADFRGVAHRGWIYSPKGNDPARRWKRRNWPSIAHFVAEVCPNQLDEIQWALRSSATR